MSELGIYLSELSKLNSSSIWSNIPTIGMFLTLRNRHLCVTQRASWKSEQDTILERVFETTIGNNYMKKTHQSNKFHPNSKYFLPIYAGKTITNNKFKLVEVALLKNYITIDNGALLNCTHYSCNKLRRDEF